MSRDERTLTVDGSTQASHPGRLRVDPILWLRHYPKWPIIWLSLAVGSVALGVWVHWAFGIATPILLFLNWFYWRRVQEHFQHGCVNPSIVVSISPLRVAVATDLTKGDGRYPVIKVIQKSLPGVMGQEPIVGMRLATVALYQADPNDTEDLAPHWLDFDPRPAECATRDVDAVQRAFLSLGDEDWRDLDEWFEMAGRPSDVGIYRVWEMQSWQRRSTRGLAPR